MNPETQPDEAGKTEEGYSLEFIAAHAGVDTLVIRRYQQKGFIRPLANDGGGRVRFDGEALRQVRRIEHLRIRCEVNEAGLELILGLLREVEALRDEQRGARR
jgi:DNA-binding transcriptional MerR regulator